MPQPPPELPPTTFYQDWVHAGWHDKRARVYAGLVRTGQTPARCWAFAGCCSCAHLEERDFQNGIRRDFRIRSSRCHDRFCVPCSQIRTHDIQAALHKRTKGMIKPMLITLTLISKPADALAAQLKLIKSSFARLREIPLWARACRGGAAFVEVTRGKLGDRWHVHLHIIADSDFMGQGELTAAWKACSSGSCIVYLERPHSGSGVAYAAKYGSKGIDYNIAATPELLDETLLAFKGYRNAFCFGDWYGTSFAADIEEEKLDDEETASAPWHTVCTLQSAAAAALEGDPYFAAALAATRIARWLDPPSHAPPL